MNTTRDMLAANLDSIADDLQAIWQAIDAGGWTCTECGESEDDHDADDLGHDYDAPEDTDCGDPLDVLHQRPLEIVYEVGEPFAVVLTVGGPHIEIVGGGRSDGYVLVGYWGGTEVQRRSDAVTRTGDYFREICGEVSAA